MASTKISELTAANYIAVSDVLPFVSDPSGSPTTKKITANNLANSLFSNVQVSVVPSANVTYNLGSATKSWNNVYVKALYANGALGANGTILASNGTASYWATSTSFVTNVNAQYTWTNNHTFDGGVTFRGSVAFSTPSEINFVSNTLVQMQYSPNSAATSSNQTDSSWVYTIAGAVGAEVFQGTTLRTGLYLGNNDVRITASNNNWTFANSSLVFPDSTTQSTAVNKVDPPANSSATGTTGQISWDSNSIYICVATDTWKKVDLSVF